MTRQTRVGLVLGLFFIVAFGLILSELQTLGTPQDAIDSVASPIETDYTHAQPAPARGPLVDPNRTHRTEPVHPDYARRDARTQSDPRRDRIAGMRIDRPDWTDDMVTGTIERPREDAATVRERTARRAETVPRNERRQPERAPAPATYRPYTVRSGDSLSRIAARVYGADHADQYLRIYEANRDILSSPDALPVGQTLRIPPLGGTTTARAPSRAVSRTSTPRGYREMTLEELDRSVGQRVLETRRPTTYVVRAGDNLTRIARRVLQDSSPEAVDRLYEANRDRLRSPNHLTEGMTLRIPG